MIFSLIVLFLINKGIIEWWDDPLWLKLMLGTLCEVVAYFTFLYFQSKKDLRTNFGRKKND